MECLGLHNKPKAEVHLGHLLTGPKEVEEEFLTIIDDDVTNDELIFW
jgi:hypothetical protein